MTNAPTVASITSSAYNYTNEIITQDWWSTETNVKFGATTIALSNDMLKSRGLNKYFSWLVWGDLVHFGWKFRVERIKYNNCLANMS